MSLETTARGGGYFVVWGAPTPIPRDVIDGPAWLRDNALRLTSHREEREALVKCSQILEAVKAGGPVVFPYYTHELCVRVVETVIEEHVAPPPPSVLETIPAGEAVDFLELVDELVPNPAAEYVIGVDGTREAFWAAVDIHIDRTLAANDYRLHGIRRLDPATGKKRLFGTCWRGAVSLWDRANVRLLLGGK